MDLGKHYNYVLNGVLQGLVEGLIWKYTYGNSAWNSTSKAGGVIGKVAKYMRVTKEGADKLYSLTTLGKVLIEGSKAYAIDAIDAGLDSDVDFNLLGTSVKSVGNMLSVYLYEKTFGPVIKKVTEKFIKVPESSASNNVEEVVNNVEETIDDIIPTEKPLSPSSILSTDKSSKTDIVVFENKKSVDWYDENVVLSNVKTSIGKVTGKPVKDIMKEYAGLGINYVLGNE